MTAEDVLGAPYTFERILLPDDDEGEVIATLVRRPAERARKVKKAVLYVHGFSDYFFQTELGQWWADRGYDFYALDLRKYGRSLLPHQTPNYVTEIDEYFPEIDEAWKRITQRDGHDQVVLTAHSTGGLTLSLWADSRQPHELTGMVLNSPWLDLQGSMLLRVVGAPVIKQLGSRAPKLELRRAASSVYARTLHQEFDGEWNFNLEWKPLHGSKVYAGWLGAILRAQARLHTELDVPAPVLVLSSTSTHWTGRMSEHAHTSDLVVDVHHIRYWATSIGRHVTYVAVEGARHDVVLSRPDVRARVYDEMETWARAYL